MVIEIKIINKDTKLPVNKARVGIWENTDKDNLFEETEFMNELTNNKGIVRTSVPKNTKIFIRIRCAADQYYKTRELYETTGEKDLYIIIPIQENVYTKEPNIFDDIKRLIKKILRFEK